MIIYVILTTTYINAQLEVHLIVNPNRLTEIFLSIVFFLFLTSGLVTRASLKKLRKPK